MEEVSTTTSMIVAKIDRKKTTQANKQTNRKEKEKDKTNKFIKTKGKKPKVLTRSLDIILSIGNK